MSPIIKRNVEVIELIMTALVVLGAIAATWVNINSRLSILETKQDSDEDFKIEMRTYFKELQEGQTEILIKLEDKQNK